MLTSFAPAKINWSLYVLDRMPGGYHNILSLLHCINLFDEIKIEPAKNIEVISNTDIPSEQNLVHKAALMLKKHSGLNKGARIILNKAIPTGAGLGGGSSDAAHTLMGLNKFWELGFDNNELTMIGEVIGSDVPFFFHCPIALVAGRGELVEPLIIDTSYPLLLIKPPVSVSTSWAYDMLRQERLIEQYRYDKSQTMPELTKKGFERDNIELIYEALVRRDFLLLQSIVHNDFESIITTHFPVIRKLKTELLNSGAYAAMMTGSGSVVFGLFRDRQEAVIASRKFTSFWHTIVDTLINI